MVIITGVDFQILKRLEGNKELVLSFKVLSVMSLANIILALVSGFYLGSQTHFPWFVTMIFSIFLAWFVWCIQIFINQTTESNLGYLNKYGELQKSGIGMSEILRIIIMIFIGAFVLQGVKLFIFSGPIEAFSRNLESGKISSNVLSLSKIDIKDMLHRSLLHKLLMVEMIYERRPIVLWTVDIVTIIMYCIPTFYKTITRSIRYSEYELAKQTIEAQLIIEDYEQSLNLQRLLLWKHHNVEPEKYEAFEDAPFNTIRVYPPMQQKLEWDTIENIWKIKSEKK